MYNTYNNKKKGCAKKMKLKNIFKKQHITYIYCPRCGSPFVTYETLDITNGNGIHTKTYKIHCETCGLNGMIKEAWGFQEKEDI